MLRNEKGLFNSLMEKPLITKSGILNLEMMLNNELSCPFKESEKTTIQNFINLVRQLPIRRSFIWRYKKNDILKSEVVSEASYLNADAYCFFVLSGNFKSERIVMDLDISLEKIQKNCDLISQIAAIPNLSSLLNQVEISLIENHLSRTKNYNKQIKNWRIDEDVLENSISEAIAFGVYLDGKGYLNHRGFFSKSLAAARQFESAEAAKKVIKGKKLKDAVIVELETYLKQLVELKDLPLPNSMNEIQQGLALADRLSLKKALEKEEIKHKLELLEKIQQEHPEWFEETQRNSSQTKKVRL